MPVEPPKKIYEIPQIQRKEGPAFQQRKKQKPLKDEQEQKKDVVKSGKVDIKI